MKIRLLTVFALAAMVGVATAGIIPNGDFESGGDQWVEAFGGGAVTFAYEATGGNGGGYATIDAGAGAWAVLVSPPEGGAAGGGIPIGDIGANAGVANTFSIDLITLSGAAGGGMKVEAWAGNALIGNSGDVNAPGANASWTTFTFDWTVPAGTEKLIFVPLWGNESKIGYDNVGVNVIPEPATMGLMGLFGGGLLFFRRKFKI